MHKLLKKSGSARKSQPEIYGTDEEDRITRKKYAAVWIVIIAAYFLGMWIERILR